MSDLLSSFLAGQMAKTYVTKIYKGMNIIVVLAFTWTVFSLLNLYRYIENTPAASKLRGSFYQYKLLPAISVAELAMNIIWILLLHNAWGNWKKYFETSDDNLLDKGFKDFYSAIMIVLVWFILSIANTFYTTFVR